MLLVNVAKKKPERKKGEIKDTSRVSSNIFDVVILLKSNLEA